MFFVASVFVHTLENFAKSALTKGSATQIEENMLSLKIYEEEVTSTFSILTRF